MTPAGETGGGGHTLRMAKIARRYGVPLSDLRHAAELLYEHIAEAFEPEWLDLLARILIRRVPSSLTPGKEE